jgi:Subtilase family
VKAVPSDERHRENSPRTDVIGSPDSDAEATLSTEITRELDELAGLRDLPEDRRELYRVMRERSGPGGTDVAQFDYLPVEEGWDTLLVPDGLLITKESFASARTYLTELQLKDAPLGCKHLTGEVVKLTHRRDDRHLTTAELAHLARMLRRRGFSAGLTHAVVTGPVGKHHCRPRPAQAQKLSLRAKPKGPKVAVIDTGISPQRRSTVSKASQDDVLHQFPLGNSAADRAERKAYLSLAAGHGTFATGIVQQLAPAADITVYRAMNSDGIGGEVQVACAMIQAARDGNQIINLSLGCQTHDNFPPVAMQRALEIISGREREKQGQEVIMVAAAGNYGDTRPCWPAAFPGVVSVAALDPGLAPARWSSRGAWITCSTVGQGVTSTFVDGTESPVVGSLPGATAQQPTFHGKPPWATWSGTSFAAPQIAGRLAAEYQTGAWPSLRAALHALLRTGRPLADYGQAIEILSGV